MDKTFPTQSGRLRYDGILNDVPSDTLSLLPVFSDKALAYIESKTADILPSLQVVAFAEGEEESLPNSKVSEGKEPLKANSNGVSNLLDIAGGINTTVFIEAITRYGDGPLTATKLALLFKDPAQFEKFREGKTTGRVDKLVQPFDLSAANQYTGLSDFLLAIPDDPLSKEVDPSLEALDNAVVKNWTNLTQSQKKLPFAKLIQLVRFVDIDLDKENPWGSRPFALNESLSKSLFRMVELHPELTPTQAKKLAEVVIAQPKVLDTFKPAQVESALIGWQLDVTFPQEIACQVGSLKTPWHQAAAKLAWAELTRDKPVDLHDSIKPEDFWKKFEAVKSQGKTTIVLQHGDPAIAVESLFPTLAPDVHDAMIAAALCRFDAPNPVHKLVGLQAGAFRDALQHLQDESQRVAFQTKQLDHNSARLNPQFAFGLAAVFGKEWKQWLDTQAKQGVNTHDASFWLPHHTPRESNGLKEFLFKHSQRTPSDLSVIAQKWPHIPAEVKEKPFKEVLSFVRSQTYSKAIDSSFAQESARWAISQEQYTEFEKRFLISRATPSPFPLHKSWETANLKGFFLPRNDPRGLYMGEHTHCCQHPQGAAASAAWHGQESPDGGFFIVTEKSSGKTIAGSWAWVSDNGGICFDTIEAEKVSLHPSEISQIYLKASADLVATQFHTVTTSTKGKFAKLDPKLTSLPSAEEAALKPPSNYSQYTDTRKNNQVILAQNKEIPKRQTVSAQPWVRGAAYGDTAKLATLSERIYPSGWRNVPNGDFKIVLDSKTHGAIGYAVIDRAGREINDIAVSPEHRNQSAVLLRAVLNHVQEVGGEWTCTARESTSFALLNLAARRGLIEIHSSAANGSMNGETMYDVKFSAVAPVTPISATTETELNKQIQLVMEAMNEHRAIKEIPADQFRELLRTALTKVKNTSVIPVSDLGWIEEMQKLVETNSQKDLSRLRIVQEAVANSPAGSGKKSSLPELTLVSDASTKKPTGTAGIPSAMPLPAVQLEIEQHHAKQKENLLPGNKLPDSPHPMASRRQTVVRVAKYGSGISAAAGLSLAAASEGLKFYERHFSDNSDKSYKKD